MTEPNLSMFYKLNEIQAMLAFLTDGITIFDGMCEEYRVNYLRAISEAVQEAQHIDGQTV